MLEAEGQPPGCGLDSEHRGAVNSRCTNESAYERANAEEGDDETFTDGREGTCVDIRAITALGETLEEVWHEEDIGDLARVILERRVSAWDDSTSKARRTPKMNPPIEARTASIMAIHPIGRPSLHARRPCQ